ncbi:MAG TPA: pentapeptide repeat-containing protein [Thermomicrobiales bacterium]|nr:pentapeptide repeat-containing protein [Thermomicrobiales bacterium]
MSPDDRTHKNYDDVNLSGADLSESDLSSASLRRSQLKGANLQNATLAGSDLHGAHLDHANVTGADLRGADLTGASLHGVDLDRAATIVGARFAGATGVTGDRTADDDTQALEDHVAQAAEDIVLITRDIAALASAASGPDDEDRSSIPERIAELQRRRSLLEERMLSLIDDAAQEAIAAHGGVAANNLSAKAARE